MDIPRNQSKWKRRLLGGLTVVAVLGALGLITVGVSRLKPADPSVNRATVVIDSVKRGSILRQVRGYGKLVPEEMHWIPARTEGRVERILVQPGAIVGPDTVLLEMSNAELAGDVATAEMEVKAAEAEYISLRVRLEKEVLDQRAALATIEADYSQATLVAQLNEQLAKDGLISDLQFQVSKSKAEELTTRLEIEKKRLEISSEAVRAQLAAQAARVDQYRPVARFEAGTIGRTAGPGRQGGSARFAAGGGRTAGHTWDQSRPGGESGAPQGGNRNS